MKEAPLRQTLTRHWDQPKLEIGDSVSMKGGVVGLVLASYTASGDERKEISYIVEVTPDATHTATPR